MLTVKELKKQLQGWPNDYVVAFTSHDNEDGEVQGWAKTLFELEPGRDFDKDRPCVVIGT